MTNWRTHGVDTVAAFVPPKELTGLARSVTVGPNEVAVVIRDGEIANVFTEGKAGTRGLGDLLRALAGRGPDIQVLIADTSPFNLSFWLEEPGAPVQPGEGSPFGIPAVTSDGQLITAQVNLTLSVEAEGAELLLRLLRGRRAMATSDVALSIKDELLGKVIALELSKHSAGELRGSDDLLRSVYESLRVQLDSTLSGYGLRLVNFFINWGLSQDEREKIEEQRHQARVRAIEREKELEAIAAPGQRPPERVTKAADRVPVGGIPYPWVRLLVVMVVVAILAVVFLTTRGGEEPTQVVVQVPPAATAVPVTTAQSPAPGPIAAAIAETTPTPASTAAIPRVPSTVVPLPTPQTRERATGSIDPDGTLGLPFRSPDIAIKGLSVATAGVDGEFTVEIETLDTERLTEGQRALERAPDRDPYQYVRVKHDTLPDNNVASVTISFAVEIQWMSDRGHGEDEIALLRFTDGWATLPTLLRSKNPTHLIYEATSPGLSLFAIAAMRKPSPTPTPLDPEPTSTATPRPTPTATVTPMPTRTPTPRPIAKPTPRPAATLAPVAIRRSYPTRTPTPTATPTITPRPTATPTSTPTSTATPTPTPEAVVTRAPSILHPVVGMEGCMMCHGASIPASHSNYGNDLCVSCHAQPGGTPWPTPTPTPRILTLDLSIEPTEAANASITLTGAGRYPQHAEVYIIPTRSD